MKSNTKYLMLPTKQRMCDNTACFIAASFVAMPTINMKAADRLSLVESWVSTANQKVSVLLKMWIWGSLQSVTNVSCKLSLGSWKYQSYSNKGRFELSFMVCRHFVSFETSFNFAKIHRILSKFVQIHLYYFWTVLYVVLANWLDDSLTDWMFGWWLVWQADELIDWINDWMEKILFVALIDWQADRQTDGQIDSYWFIHLFILLFCNPV